MRCALAIRLDRPCLSKTDIKPKAAGTLCIISAMKMMKLSLLFELVDEAPRAMPSAAAWITRPTVVELGRPVEPWGCEAVSDVANVSATGRSALSFDVEDERLKLNWFKLI